MNSEYLFHKETQIWQHIGAGVYALSWTVDLINYFMTAYEMIPMATILNPTLSKTMTKADLSMEIQKAHAIRGIVACALKIVAFCFIYMFISESSSQIRKL